MAGGTDNNQLKSAKTRWQWRQQFVDDNEDNNDDDDEEHDKQDDDDNKDGKHDYEGDEDDEDDNGEQDDDDHDNMDDDDDNEDNKANTTTAVGCNDNGCNSNGRGHRQQSTKIGSKDTVAVATAMETAAAGAATTAAACQRLPPWALAQMELPLPPPGRVVGAGCDGCVWGCACWLCVCCMPLLFR
jgi:hypothetical protein